MASYYGRCLARINGRKCTGRRMLTKRPGEYVRPPKCPHCGGRRWYLDTNIVRRHRAEAKCWCEGYHFQHRKGSRYCVHHPEHVANWARRMGEQDTPGGAWEPGRE